MTPADLQAVSQHQLGPITREQARGGSANATGSAGDRDDLVVDHGDSFDYGSVR